MTSNGLSFFEAQVLSRRGFGKSLIEIAKELECSITGVTNALRRGKRKSQGRQFVYGFGYKEGVG